jgi:FKBP-type peptidyl-prolyl cis-trans isomerase FkpA
MKKKLIIVFAVMAVLVFSGCDSGSVSSAGSANSLDSDQSYAMGMFIGMFMSQQMGVPSDVGYDYKSFAQGFEDFVEAKETRFSMEDGMAKIQAKFQEIAASQDEMNQAAGAENLEKGAAFLAENGAKPGVTTTPSGLQYEVVAEGTGEKPAASDTVRVNYEGTLLDGTVFDSSYTRGEPAEFPLAGVIPGWTEGLQLMPVGSTYRFFIPSELAYGSQGNPSIPPNSTLIFKVDLLEIVE